MDATRRSFRPVAVSLIMWLSTAILVVLMIVIGRALPEDVVFTVSQAATLWAFVALVALLAYAVSRSRVHADDEGLTVVNGFRRRRLRWDEVGSIAMREGAPWPTLVTREDERVILFAIQGSDGAAAREAVAWLQERLR
ncbi:PH domain-containing protein [Aeromicrobium phragmitis]|uniref:PH domain-containing protein n=1 Tax=Aeromicrobium phragmitis TaxID=2478914 RepID=A0A3L8PN24_9ACTN|nr:PH domain-containing protein [Aeromicrobium phragmitis]RLV55442.1 PH domain-containing protein [Aeromicrobium phragmitis]